MLVDFRANGNFIHRDSILDPSTLSTAFESQVHLPDESGVSAAGIGTFCAQPAHYLPSFDKSLRYAQNSLPIRNARSWLLIYN